MNSVNKKEWVFFGQYRQHLVQVVHHVALRRFLVKLNGTILFDSVWDHSQVEEEFSFFVDGELCELKVKREDVNFNFEFINHEFSTSKTGLKKKWWSKVERYGLASFGIFVSLVFLIFGIAYFLNKPNKLDLNNGGVQATAVLIYAGENKLKKYRENNIEYELSGNLHYKFKVDNKWFYGDGITKKNGKGERINEAGFSINSGAEYQVIYSAKNPGINKLLLNQPSSSEIEKIKESVRGNCLEQIEERKSLVEDLFLCDCIRYYLFDSYGLKGLAQLKSGALKRQIKDEKSEWYIILNRMNKNCKEKLKKSDLSEYNNAISEEQKKLYLKEAK